jgi:hypothetical protein
VRRREKEEASKPRQHSFQYIPPPFQPFSPSYHPPIHRCIALLILLVAGAGVAALALRIKYGGLSPGSTNPAAAPAGGRRLLLGGGSS